MKQADQRKKKGHGAQNFIVITIITVVLLAGFGALMYTSVQDVSAKQLGVTAYSTTNAVANMIMEDPGAFLKQAASGNAKSEYYIRMQQYMQEVTGNNNVTYIFAEVPLAGTDTVAYVLGSEPEGSKSFIQPNSTDLRDIHRANVYSMKTPHTSGLFRSLEGVESVAVYSPIIDQSGAVIGLVGAWVDASGLFTEMIDIFSVVVFVSALVFAVMATFGINIYPHVVSLRTRDQVTGAYNSRYLKRYLSAELKKAKRANKALSVIMIDIDRFDEIGEKFGQEFGKLVMKYFSMRVMHSLRANDRYCRYSGSVFIAILPNTTIGMATRVGARIRNIARNNRIQNLASHHSIIATISAGVAAYSQVSQTPDKLLAEAQVALNEAKERGNTVATVQQGAVALTEN